MRLGTFKAKMVHLQNFLTIKLVTFGFFVDFQEPLTRLGTNYGGWHIPQSLLVSRSRKTLLSVGVGFDVSFDRALANSNFNVILLDPLIESIRFARNELKEFENVHFENFALSNHLGTEKFFPPKNLHHDAWSSTNVQSTNVELAQDFQVVTLDWLLLKYSQNIGTGEVYLKMDIEGAETKIIEDICRLNNRLDFLGVEFDFLSLIPFLSVNRRLKSILQARVFLKELQYSGFELVHAENFNFFWGKRSNA